MTAVAALDFSKAFDTLDHDVLLSSLHHIGMWNNTVEWFCTYLSNCLQHVRYANEISDALPISHDVPKGSVLGPLLYIIYVNELLYQLPDGCAITYADDITLLTSGLPAQSAASNLQQLITTVESWFAGHSLCHNYTKCLHYVCLPIVAPASCLSSNPGRWAFYQPSHWAQYLGCDLLICPIIAITRQQSES